MISYLSKIATDNLFDLIAEVKDLASEEPIRLGEKDSDFSKPYISFVQAQLITIGFDFPFKKGEFDKFTEEAIKTVEKANNLPITGTLNLYSSAAIFTGRTVKTFFEEPGSDPSLEGDKKYNLEKEKFTKTPSGANRASLEGLWNDLYSKIKNEEMVAGIIGNAYVESEGLIINNGGDSHICSKHPTKCIYSPYRGTGCCSFGLWQFNVCGGLGESLLMAYGDPKDDEDKLEILQDYDKQVEFMSNYITSRFSNMIDKKESPEWFAEWFMREVERPSERAITASVGPRKGYARSVYDKMVKAKGKGISSGTDSNKISILDLSDDLSNIKMSSDRVNLDDLNPGVKEYLKVLNYFAKESGKNITITSAVRDAHDQARIMLDNYVSKGGRSYLLGLYGENMEPIADIFDSSNSKEYKITKATEFLKKSPPLPHLRGDAIDISIRDGKNDILRIIKQTKDYANVNILDEGDHLHVTVKPLESSQKIQTFSSLKVGPYLRSLRINKLFK